MSTLEGLDNDRIKESLGLSTYRSFTLIRDELRQVLSCAIQGKADYKSLCELTTMGTVHCEAALRFARASGLVGSDNWATPFGKLAWSRDTGIDDLRTQWTIHYHMVRPNTAGPAFWTRLHAWFLSVGEATQDEVSKYVTGMAPDAGHRAIKYAVTAFIGSYLRTDGLGNLHLVESTDGNIRLSEPSQPSLSVSAYVLADYWRSQWEDVKTVNLSSMTEPGGPAALLYMSSGDINSVLREMASHGLVEVNRKVPPYQVVRLWNSPEELLEHLYE